MTPKGPTKAQVAYETVFGEEPLPRALDGLTTQTLKKAYRRKLRECHPDRARSLGRRVRELEERCKELNVAYELLEKLLQTRRKPEEARGRTTPAPEPGADHFWDGSVPARPLRFGQYLYYRRRISWLSLVRAVTWQRRNRPSFGRIAQGWNFLRPHELEWIARWRVDGERIGDAAVRLGLLSSFARDVVMGTQLKTALFIGRYFLEQGLVTEDELEELLRAHWVHNQTHGSMSGRSAASRR